MGSLRDRTENLRARLDQLYKEVIEQQSLPQGIGNHLPPQPVANDSLGYGISGGIVEGDQYSDYKTILKKGRKQKIKGAGKKVKGGCSSCVYGKEDPNYVGGRASDNSQTRHIMENTFERTVNYENPPVHIKKQPVREVQGPIKREVRKRIAQVEAHNTMDAIKHTQETQRSPYQPLVYSLENIPDVQVSTGAGLVGGKKKKEKQHRKESDWIKYVKKVAHDKGITYPEALQVAKKLWKK